MQCKILAAIAVSFLTFAVSAAPIPDASKGVHILDREIEHAPLVGMSDVAREAAPEPETEESPEARACRLYSCIWCVSLTPPISYLSDDLRRRSPSSRCTLRLTPSSYDATLFYLGSRSHWSTALVHSVSIVRFPM
ncbi:hypothetical protein C8R44DRAFT_885074 [Mycena epipterygia]|nr:hypothetical protein C8R44DRAFT_885074 [Mycena epipterygia]